MTAVAQNVSKTEERIQVLTSGEPAYPALLKEIRGYPKTLYYIGDVRLLRSRCAAVIGSRTTTAYGRNIARAIGRTLAEAGVTVVSGLAGGIDTCGHEGVLCAQGMTIAVLGCGPDICYPKQNRQLMRTIEQRGLVISEYPPGTQPAAYHFPQRNRIISGLSELVVVVQARIRSGALITAELAAEQGRELCAVPGNIDSQYHRGTNKLIQDGATVITSVEEIPALMGLAGTLNAEALRSLSETEMRIYQMIESQGELGVDEICLQLSMEPFYVVPILSSLELKGILCSAAGKFFLANL